MHAPDGPPLDEIASERLRLRPPRRGDAAELHRAVVETLPELGRWLAWARPDYGKLDARRYLRGARLAWARRTALEFCLEERASGELVGVANLHRIDWERRSAGLGYWVRRSRWGAGFATEAAEAAVGHGFAHLGLHRIEIQVAVGNRASHAVVAKLGARREGVARHYGRVGDAWLDHVQYSLLSTDGLRPLSGGA